MSESPINRRNSSIFCGLKLIKKMRFAKITAGQEFDLKYDFNTKK